VHIVRQIEETRLSPQVAHLRTNSDQLVKHQMSVEFQNYLHMVADHDAWQRGHYPKKLHHRLFTSGHASQADGSLNAQHTGE
jgi:hypothetical protein